MRRFILATSISLVATVGAGADVRDVRSLSGGETPEIFIAFDTAPELLGARIEGQTIELDLSGLVPGARRIEPRGQTGIRAILLSPAETGQHMRIELSGIASDLRVVPTETGFRIGWHASGNSAATSDQSPGRNPGAADSGLPDAYLTTPNSQSDADVVAETEPSSPEPLAVADATDAASADTGTGSDCDTAHQAVEADPWDIDALTVHASCLLDAGETDEAVVVLERVIAFEPGRFDAVIALAEAHEARGDVNTARALYEQAANVAETDGQAVAARARARALTN